MKILVTGVRGQLGFDVMNELKGRGHQCVGVDIEEMDITDAEEVKKVITEAEVSGVVHCAAYTAVDAAETNQDLCHEINVDGTRNIAKICKELDIKMIYISTDYVFDGQGERPWEPDDTCCPLNTYGQSKYEGEEAVKKYLDKFYIVRISWVFGLNGNNFVKTMLKLFNERDKLTVVNDQFGSPTYTFDLAVLLVDMIETDKYGYYHATNEGICTWYDFAKEILSFTKKDIEITPVDSSQFKVAAKRPSNSRMSKEKLEFQGFNRLPTWQDALKRYISVLNSTMN